MLGGNIIETAKEGIGSNSVEKRAGFVPALFLLSLHMEISYP